MYGTIKEAWELELPAWDLNFPYKKVQMIFLLYLEKKVCTEDSKLKNKFHAWYEKKVSHLFFNSPVMPVINWPL
jgi:hypothetical protein